MRTISWGFLIVLLAGCNARFRAPPCPPGHWELPAEAMGVYRVTMFSVANADHSKNQIMDGRFEVKATPQSYAFRAHKGLVNSAIKSSPDGSPVATTLLSLQSFSAACRLAGHDYLQSLTQGGAYSLLRVEASAAGLALNPIGFNLQELRQQHYQVIDVPTLGKNADGVSYASPTADIINAPIIDNAQLDGAGNDRLLSHAEPESFGYFFARVNDAHGFAEDDGDQVVLHLPR